jgi:replicative DNA helicase
VDYLQLMDAPDVKESRQQQITAISRGLKAVAREMNVPLVALCQLNRQVESREGHRPRISDLSDCVDANTLLLNADTGTWDPIRSATPGMRVFSVDAGQKLIVGTVDQAWTTGVRTTFTLTTRTGKRVTGTADHPVLTDSGWKTIASLSTN